MKPPLRIPLREKLAYGCGDAACNLYWRTFTVFLMFYYTDSAGLPAAAVGTMFLITRIWDSVYDFFVGMMADRTSTRWGKFRPYLIWAALPFAMFGVLTFTVPDLTQQGKLTYAYVTYGLVMLFYSTVNVPYGALMGVVSSSSQERTSFSSYRFVFAFGAGLLVQFVTLPLVKFFGRGDSGRGFFWVSVIWAVGVVVLLGLCFLGTRERVQPSPRQQTSWKQDLKDLGRNLPWVVVLGLTLLVQIAACARDGSIVYYFKYYMGNETLVSAFLVTGTLSSLVGTLLVQFVTERLGRKHTYQLLLGLAALFMIAGYWVKPGQVVPIFILHILVSLMIGPTMVVVSAMKADAVDYSEWRTGRRATGLVFSAASLASKIGWAVGGAATGWMLAAFGFTANVEQSAHTQDGLRLMISFVPAAAAIAAAIVATWYPLDEATVGRIEQELESRRRTDTAAGSA